MSALKIIRKGIVKMAKLSALFSSSKANSILFSSSEGNILIDCGASFKATNQALENLGIHVSDISAVLITHEHSDHVKGLKTFTSKCNAPVISTSKTLEKLAENENVCKNAKLIAIENSLEICGLQITRFQTSHDSIDPSGYRIDLSDGRKAAVCTDLGIVTETVRNSLCGCNAVLIESNHDIKMLQNGPYPPELKMRIASEKGHINNNACAALLKELIGTGSNRFILGHLSENNNTPILAQAANEAALMDVGAKNGEDYILKVASPTKTETVYF